MRVARKINDGDENNGDDNFEIRVASRIAKIIESQGVNNRVLDEESKRGRRRGEREVGNDFGNVCGKCGHTRVRSRGGVRAFRLAVQSWFSSRRAFCPDREPSEGSRGSGYGHLGYSRTRPISRSHMRLSLLRRIPRLRIARQGHWISSPSFSAALFSSFLFPSSFFSFYFAHPLTRAAGRFQQKCDTNGAIQI